MAEHNELGNLGEEQATAFLLSNGYEILERNWFYKKAEVDIIALKASVLAVIEVKTRSTKRFGLPQDFVNAKKISLLVMAINEYVTSRNLDVEVRFDIMAVHHENGCFSIEHLEDAFYHF